MPLLQSCDRNSKSLHNEQHIILAGHSSIQNRTGSFELLDHHHKTTPYDSWFASPECVGSKENSNDQFCLHTSNVFADFRGISILSKPQAAERILQLPAFAIEGVAGTVNDELDPPYSRQSLPGRGFGLLANRTLYRGDRIMSKTPLYMVDEALYQEFELPTRKSIQHKAISQLPARSTNAFLELCGHFGGDHIDDVINTNSFAVDLWPGTENETAFNIVLPEISRLNHDCRPNAHYFFDTKTLTHHVYALRTIHSGEELTISYIDPTQTRDVRRRELIQNWGFECSCSSCTQSTAVATASDTRVQQILALQKHLMDRDATSQATAEMAEFLVSLYAQERLLAPVAEAHTLAAYEYNGQGEGYLAMKHASLAVELGLVYGGVEYADVLDMKKLLEEPSKHWSWKFRDDRK